MLLVESLDQISRPFQNAVITIGNFDGVHKGHQALLKQVISKAKKISGTSVALTFEPHPLRALGIDTPPLITRHDQKMELLDASGIDVVICLHFDKAFAALSARDFIENILVGSIGMKSIIIGPDYTFGKDRTGNIDLLKEQGKVLGFETVVADWIKDPASRTHRISSTRIRQIVMDGQVEKAREFLGRHYQIRGKVVQGRRRGGSQLGFPTANIKLHDELCPKFGVYAVTVETIHGNFMGVANIGYSPTFDDHIFTIEVHILDFDYEIYGTRIRVNLVARLRDEKKFANLEELSDQIRKDIETAKEILSKNGFVTDRHIS
ncbi:MAG: bifunctional riboflavin kinase/FAD synthetase [Desulfotignum sp.]|nr:bifunctional riboflavin kinase/FAD synthetase [Desulfotignum sp.]